MQPICREMTFSASLRNGQSHGRLAPAPLHWPLCLWPFLDCCWPGLLMHTQQDALSTISISSCWITDQRSLQPWPLMTYVMLPAIGCLSLMKCWCLFEIYHEFHETCHSVTSSIMKKDSKRCCDTTTPELIHTKDESKRGSAFAFIFGVNWPLQWM